LTALPTYRLGTAAASGLQAASVFRPLLQRSDSVTSSDRHTDFPQVLSRVVTEPAAEPDPRR